MHPVTFWGVTTDLVIVYATVHIIDPFREIDEKENTSMGCMKNNMTDTADHTPLFLILERVSEYTIRAAGIIGSYIKPSKRTNTISVSLFHVM